MATAPPLAACARLAIAERLGAGSAPLRLWPLSALPEVRPGDDLAGMLAERAAREGVAAGDVVAVAHKVVSKAEGRIVALAAVRPGAGRGRRWPARPARTRPSAS